MNAHNSSHLTGKKNLTWGSVSTYRQEIMGFACLWIICHHNYFNWPDRFAALEFIMSYGNAGVDMFLFLSGVGLYFAYQRKPGLGNFYKRRLVRLLVPYTFIAVPFWIWKDIILAEGSFLMDVTFLSSYMVGNHMTWYVGASLVFYLMFPFVYKLLYETDRIFGIKLQKNTLAILLPTFLAASCWALLKISPEFYKEVEIGLTRSMIFVIGCVAGQWVFEKKPLRRETVYFCAIFLVFYFLGFAPMVKLGSLWIRFSYAPLGVSVVVLMTAIFNRYSMTFIRRILTYFGNRSLELYLMHVLLRYLCQRFGFTTSLDPWGIGSYAVIIGISLVIGEIVHRLSGWISSRLLALPKGKSQNK